MWKLAGTLQQGQARHEAPQEPSARVAPGNGSRATAGREHEQVSTTPQAAPTSASGGGGHRSISAEFNVNPVTGTMSLSLPVYTSPGRSGFGPKLALSYDSGSGDGMFGVGWQLSTLSISRKTSKGIPKYDGSDVFVLSSFDDLVPAQAVMGGDVVEDHVGMDGVAYRVQQYKPRVETEVTRIQCWTRKDDPNDVHWRTETADNYTTFFGEGEESRVFDQGQEGGPTRIFSWLTSRTVDAAGNAIHFEYKQEDFRGAELLNPEDSLCEVNRSNSSRRRMRYLKRIRYGNVHPSRDLETWKIIKYTKDWMFEVVFDYGDHSHLNPSPEEQRPWEIRQHPFSVRSAGFELRTYRLCQRIMMFHRFPEQMQGREYVLVSSAELDYTSDNGVTLLKSFQNTGYLPQGAMVEDGLYRETLPPVEFEYTQMVDALGVEVKEAPRDTLHQMSSPTGWKTEWIDLEGEGAPGSLLEVPGGSLWYQRNEMLKSSDPETFGPVRELSLRPNTSTQDGHYFEDLNRNGRMNMVCLDCTGTLEGFYERGEAQQWMPLEPFPSTPSAPIRDSATKRIDLTGDGLADLLREEPSGEMFWYPSLGKRGFAPAQKALLPDDAPRLVSHDAQSQIYLADMTGDGLADIVEVQPGKTSYWPNLGYGRFGQRITMGLSPAFDSQDQFSHSRLHLTDVCGSGTTDMVYLPPGGGLHIYFNLAGNRWSEGVVIPNFPALDAVSSVFTLDLLGKGTSCLCWSGPVASGTTPSTLRYAELTHGTKPYLLHRYTNGIGSRTTVSYQPSTKYYLDDEQSGNPWTTRLPFPVHCVSQVVTEDCVAQTSKRSRYAYHNGHFDAVEREFRGFGIVEHWDEEEFGGDDAFLKRPPIRTKEWYHLGAASTSMEGRSKECRVSSPHRLPAELKLEQEYEVHRALKGQKLREELYSDDASDQAHLPYSVGEFSYEVRRVQAASEERSAVYRVSPLESVKAVCERQEADPRIERVLTLEVNDYGDVLKSFTVHHGRQKSDLPDAKQRRRQEASWGMYTENIFTDAIIELDCFQRPQPASTRQYAVVGLDEMACTDIGAITATNFAYFNEMEVIPYTTIDMYDGPMPRKSLVQEQRQYYLNRTLSEPLEWRQITAYSVLDRSYNLVFEEGILEKHFLWTDFLSQASLDQALEQGGYVRLKQEPGIWTVSPRKVFSRNPGENLQMARRSFYQPSVTIDPFGGVTIQELDTYQYLPRSTIDAVGNVTSFDNDYWHLQPLQTRDINGNRRQVAFDAFGCIIGTARMGKKTEEVGDSLHDIRTIVSDEAIQAFLQNPCGKHTRKLLGSASTRTLLCQGQFEMVQDVLKPVVPAFQATITCDTHYRDRTEDSAVAISITYLDGSGEPLQTTTLCHQEQAKGEVPAQWRISEWMIKNSKGNPVRVCQPSFAPDHHFRFEANIDSPKVTNLLDPLDRVRGILHPDHTWSKQRVTPWSTVEYDVGSTVAVENPALDPDVGPFFKSLPEEEYLPTWLAQQQHDGGSAAAEKSIVYAGKQIITHLDCRGRLIGNEIVLGDGKTLSTKQMYNMAGYVVMQSDVLDRLVQEQEYDVQGRVLVTRTMDSGLETVLPDCQGKPIFRWTHGTRRFRHLYDLMGREIEMRLTNSERGLEEIVLHRITYGETEPGAANRNLRGQIARVQDQSGELEIVQVDFKGNCLAQSYQLAANYKGVLDWGAAVELEDEQYNSYATFDALDRVVQATDASGCLTVASYDLVGNVRTVAARLQNEDSPRLLICDKTYGPDGSVLKIVYANGSTLDHVYDKATRRLVRKTLSRTSRLGRSQVQDLHYSWDCLGRTIRKWDAAQQPWYFRNSRTDPEWTYTYDALGQLASATGREQVDSSNAGGYRLLAPGPQKRPMLGLEMCQYRETYRYDDAGNVLFMHHAALNAPSIAGWTRRLEYNEESQLEVGVMGNRLTSTVTGQVREKYNYGVSPAGQRGCMTAMSGYSTLIWDHMDKLRCSSRQITRNNNAREQTWYVYNAAGVRVRKVTEREGVVVGTKMKERIFLPGVDIYRTYAADGRTLRKERVQSNIQATSTGAVGILERARIGNKDTGSTLVHYQPGESMELDDTGGLISYEEYTPFGSTILCAFTRDIEAPRRYRYAGYERDCETGLFFCDKRYYAPWLGRWTSPDPLGSADGLNLYRYVGNDPINMFDPTGTRKTVKEIAAAKKEKARLWDKSRIPGDKPADESVRQDELRALDPVAPDETARTRAAFEGAGIEGLATLQPVQGTWSSSGQQHHVMAQSWEGSFRLLGYDVHAYTLFCSSGTHTEVGGQMNDARWKAFWTEVRKEAWAEYSANSPKGDKYKLTSEHLQEYMGANIHTLRTRVDRIVRDNLEDFVRECKLPARRDLSRFIVADYHESTKVNMFPLCKPREREIMRQEFQRENAAAAPVTREMATQTEQAPSWSQRLTSLLTGWANKFPRPFRFE
ncbi:hypothetical protein BJX64DRAFT_284173 [Aspergillus heterothallicus]